VYELGTGENLDIMACQTSFPRTVIKDLKFAFNKEDALVRERRRLVKESLDESGNC